MGTGAIDDGDADTVNDSSYHSTYESIPLTDPGNDEGTDEESPSQNNAGRNDEQENETTELVFIEDTFSLIIVSDSFWTWIFGICVWSCQMTLLCMIILGQTLIDYQNISFFFQRFWWCLSNNHIPALLHFKGVPFYVTTEVRVGQLVTMILSVFFCKDLMEIATSFRDFREFLSTRSTREEYCHLLINYLLATLLKFVQGVSVLIINFTIIVQSDDIIDLLKDFTSLMFISDIDNDIFYLASGGYFGKAIMEKCEVVKCHTKVLRRESRTEYIGIVLSSFLMFISFYTWHRVVNEQDSGRYFFTKYPNCLISRDDIPKIGNKHCDGGRYNSIQCGYDGGDCIQFNLAYPLCSNTLEYGIGLNKVGDGKCDKDPNFEFSAECLYDGGDCCFEELNEHNIPEVNRIGEFCNGGVYEYACNVPICSAKDCDQLLLHKIGTGTHAILVHDLNNDSYPDIVIGNDGESNVILINKGNGIFHEPNVLVGTLSSTTNAIAVGDVNGDGWPDLVFGNNEDSNQLFINRGYGTFPDSGIELLSGIGLNTVDAVIKDVTGDGMSDIIIANQGDQISDCNNQVLVNDGNGHFNHDDILDLKKTPANSIVVEDMNDDGRPDIILGTGSGKKNFVLINEGNGDFTSTIFALPGGRQDTKVIAVGDLNGDKMRDLVLGSETSIMLLFNQGNTTFSHPVIIPGRHSNSNDIVITDIDNDGDADILIANDAGIPNYILSNKDGRGHFEFAQTSLPCSTPMNTVAIAIGDLDGDGFNDVVIGNEFQKNQAIINLGDGISFKEPGESVSRYSPNLEIPSATGASWLHDEIDFMD